MIDPNESWKDIYEKPFMNSSDLPDKDLKVTIERVEKERVTDPKCKLSTKNIKEGEEAKFGKTTFHFHEGAWYHWKAVIYYKGAKRGHIPNIRQCEYLSGLSGSNKPINWVGLNITLYRTETNVGGQSRPCIRMRGQRL